MNVQFDHVQCTIYFPFGMHVKITWIRRKPQIIKFMKNWLRRAEGS